MSGRALSADGVSSSGASFSIVGAQTSVLSGKCGRSKALRIRATSSAASSESPPSAKKSSATPTRSTSSTSPIISASACSSGLRGGV